MIFVLDVGNSNIKCGLFENGTLINSWRMTTRLERTSDEYGIRLIAFFGHVNKRPGDVKRIVISSVIPSINYTLQHMCTMYFDQKPMFVGPGIKTGINILYDNPKELGADRIVGAIAAYHLYGGPCIIVDFGTATTFGAVTSEGDFLGGAICPGIKISTEALTLNTARLPHIELNKPDSIIGKSTITGMQAGIIYGYVGQVDYIIGKFKKELGECAKVIATGGLAQVVSQESKEIDEINGLLTLVGLSRVYEMNKGK